MSIRDIIFGAQRAARRIKRVGASSTQNSATGNSLTITKPAGVADGHLLVAFLCSGGAAGTWTVPAGWKLVGSLTSSGTPAVAWKEASSEGADYTFTTSAATQKLAGTIVAYSGAAFGWIHNCAASTNTASAVRIGVSGSTLIGFFMRTAGSITFSAPSGMSAVASNSDADVPSWAVFDQAQMLKGSSGTKTTTPSAGTCDFAYLVSIYPKNDFGVNEPTFISESHTQNSVAGATLTITRPQDVIEGDLLVACMSGNGTANTWTGDTGWTEVVDQGANPMLRVAWKVVTSLEPGSYTFTNAAATQILSGTIVAYRNAAFDGISAINSASSGAVVTTTPTSPTKDFSRALAFICNTRASDTFNRQTNVGLRFQDNTSVRYLGNDATAPSQLLVDYGLWGADSLTVSYTPNSALGTAAAVHFFLRPAAAYMPEMLWPSLRFDFIQG